MPPIAQYLFNGLVTGGILALPSVAFSLLWKLLRFPNFAVGTYLTIGAFAAFAVNHGLGWRIAWAWLWACGVGGAGVFLGLDTTIDPLLGTGLIIAVFAAAILGGIGSAPGALLGALVVGVVEEASTLVIAPTYKSAVGFAIILVMLLVRPQGLA